MSRRRHQLKGNLTRKGPSWILKYYEHTGQYDAKGKEISNRVSHAICESSKTLKEAQRIAQQEHLIPLDYQSLRPASGQTLNQFWQTRFVPDYLPSLRPNGRLFYNNIYGKHIQPAFGNVKLRHISLAQVQSLLSGKLAPTAQTLSDGQSAPYSVQTVRHIRNILSAIFQHAKRNEAYTGDLPTQGIRLPAGNAVTRQALTWDQVVRLSDVIGTLGRPREARSQEIGRRNEIFGILVRVLARTGMRIGEALGLRWKYLNLEDEQVIVDGIPLPGQTMSIRFAYVRGAYGPLKTKSSTRDIPLDAPTLADLQRLRQLARFREPGDPVFAASTGKPLDEHNVAARHLKPAAKAIGRPDVSWHVLRHSWSTLADAAGLTVSQRQMVLGHAAGSMTLRYTHADLEGIRQGMTKISGSKLKVKTA